MYPDLLEIFGIQLFGIGFERILWGLLSALMIWGIVSSVLIFRQGRRGEGTIQGIIVAAILLWSGNLFLKTFSADYVQFFAHPIVIHSYAFCILIGIALGIGTAMKMAQKRGSNPYDIAKLCLLLVVLGFLGARGAHVIINASTYWNACFNPAAIGETESNCLRFLNFSEGGLTFYGGVIAGMLVLVWFFISQHRKGYPINPLSKLDKLGAALSITHAFGRIGCLAAGCCWGAITTGKFGIHYPEGSFAYHELAKDPAMLEIMSKTGETPLLHATQIYEATGELIIYGILWAMLFKNAKPGKMAAFWLIAYGTLRFILEFMRDDLERGYYFQTIIEPINRLFHVAPDHATILSTSQGIALVMICLGIGTLIWSHFANLSPKTSAKTSQTSPQTEKSATPMANTASQNISAEPAQTEINASSSKLPDSADIKGKKDDAKDENNDIKGENDDAKGENDDAKGENDDAKGENDDIKDENDDIKDENDDANLDNDSERTNK